MPQIVNENLGPTHQTLRRFNAVDRPDDVLPQIGIGIAERSRSFFTEVADIVGQCRGKHLIRPLAI